MQTDAQRQQEKPQAEVEKHKGGAVDVQWLTGFVTQPQAIAPRNSGDYLQRLGQVAGETAIEQVETRPGCGARAKGIGATPNQGKAPQTRHSHIRNFNTGRDQDAPQV